MKEVWYPKILLVAYPVVAVLAAVMVTPSEVVLGVGAVAYAFMLFKGQRGKILRDQNQDLRDRNTFLEDEHVRIKGEIVALQAEMASAAAEQQQLRHELRNEIALLKGQLELEQAKHDINAVAEKLETALAILQRREDMFQQMAFGISQIVEIARQRTQEVQP